MRDIPYSLFPSFSESKHESNYSFKLKCPNCGFKEKDETTFINREAYCEDCGSHSAIECPECQEVFDHVWKDRVCSECGLVDEWCDEHPDAKPLSWWTDLHRGG